MNHRGQIIFLNGLTSSGKSSIINEIFSRDDDMFFSLGFDLFEETIPIWACEIGSNYAHAIIAMYYAARGFSEQGKDVFIDGLIMNIEGLESHYKTLLELFEGYPLKIIEVYCPLEICRQRNIARGDRPENKSEIQNRIVEKNINYSFRVDTNLHTVCECADLILANILCC